MMAEFRDYYISLKLHPNQKDGLKPSQKGVIFSVNGLEWLAKFFILEQGYIFFLPGRVSNDSIENLHSIVRQYNRLPTPLMYRRYVKAISMTQCLKPYSKYLAYEEDRSADEAFLSDLSQVQKDVDDTEEVVFDYFKDVDFKPEDFSEENATAYFAGYVLGHNITKEKKRGKKNKSACATCEAVLVAKTDDEEQESCALIDLREYKKGSLVTPSETANQIFQLVEATFRKVRDSYAEENKNLKSRITTEALIQINLKITTAPQCHLELLVSKFIEARLNWWARFTNDQI